MIEAKSRVKRNFSGVNLDEDLDDDAFEEEIFELENFTASGRNNLHRKLSQKLSADPQLEAFLANEEDFR